MGEKRSKRKNWLEGLSLEGLNSLIESDRMYGYREFCRILNIPIAPSGSNSQQRQLDMLSMLCEFEKPKSKFRFIRLRDKRDVDFFRHNTSYPYLVQCALAQELLKNDYSQYSADGVAFLTITKIAEICGMINPNFITAKQVDKYKRTLILSRHPVDFGEDFYNSYINFRHFTDVAYGIVRGVISKILDSDNSKVGVVAQKGCVLYTNKGGNTQTKKVLMSSSIGREISSIRHDVLREMDIKNINDLNFRRKAERKHFYARCNELCEERLGYEGFYDCYAVRICENHIEHTLNTDYRAALNKKFKFRVYDTQQLGTIGETFKGNLVEAMISQKTAYNFEKDYKDIIECKAKKW